jgi:tetratricopeptide (TPR) repeat protein
LKPAPPTDRSLSPVLAGLLLATAIVAAYVTSFGGVMVFDDLHSIVENPTIRELSRLDRVLLPPPEGGTISGRPLVNLTLALNYAAGGVSPGGYHAVNLVIHTLAGLTLFGLVRRTLLRDRGPAGTGFSTRDAQSLALAIAALWSLHPLQTAAVTYLIQRAESLAGLCLLLTLYCFVRATEACSGDPRPLSPKRAVTGRRYGKGWLTLAFVCCLLGMAAKETMAAAPLVILLYDHPFIAGSWREAWRRRGRFHAALLGTWLLLAVLVLSTENRGGTAGLGTTVTWSDYALTQCDAIIHYLRLSFWPHPLVFDYGTPLHRSLASVAPQAGLLLLLLGGTVWAVIRKPTLGFPAAGFFLMLAPSSSLVPVATQTLAEHRMYLPLAAVLSLAAIGAFTLAGRRVVPVLLVLAIAGGALTARRNRVYHSELSLWADTVAHRPENPRARVNLGIALTEADRLPEAAEHFAEALRLRPDHAAAHLNLCHLLTRLGRLDEAVRHGDEAVRLEPRSSAARINLAQALALLGRADEAAAHYAEALRLEPEASEVPGKLAALQLGLGNHAAARGDFEGAITRFRQAVAVLPDHLQARNNLANALLLSGHVDEAIGEYRETLRRDPDNTRVQENLARALEVQNTRR